MVMVGNSTSSSASIPTLGMWLVSESVVKGGVFAMKCRDGGKAVSHPSILTVRKWTMRAMYRFRHFVVDWDAFNVDSDTYWEVTV